jgi:hypothetical protein
MNKEKLLELSDTLRGIAEGKEWEYCCFSGPNEEWFKSMIGTDPLFMIARGQNIRLKPQPPPPDPYAELKAAHAAGKTIQRYEDGGMWTDSIVKDRKQDPFGFVFSPESYRIKPEPRKVPLGPDDVKAGDEFLVGSYRQSWVSIKDGLVTYGSGGMYSFDEMMQFGHKVRSIGETEWRGCFKLIEE